MNQIISLNKPVGLTPNQMIEKFRDQFPNFSKEKIGFAGRLDPMARGVLLLTVGDANFEREKYLNLDKTYQFTLILGIETDSYDLLGLVTNENLNKIPNDYQQITDQFIKDNIGKKIQEYPPFSTKPVEGKSLFKWAKEGKLKEIEMPTKEVQIYNFKQLSESTISIKDLEKIVLEKVANVEGHFRQEETVEKWQNLIAENSDKNLITQTFEVKCSSGTYVRSLVHNLGQKLGCGAVTLDIYRTKVGTYSIDKAHELK